MDVVAAAAERLNVVRVRWEPCVWVRLTRFPAVDPFTRVSDADDRAALVALESWTGPGSERRMVPGPAAAGDRPAEPDEPDPVSAAFAALPPAGASFSDGTNAVFLAANDRATALAEARHRLERFFGVARAPSLHVDACIMEASLDGRFHDLRPRSPATPRFELDGSHARRLARIVRAMGYDGIVYASPRLRGGQSAAVFRPEAIADRRRAETIGMFWDGERIAAVYEKRPYTIEV